MAQNWRDRLYARAMSQAAPAALNMEPSPQAQRFGNLSAALGGLDVQGFMQFAGQVQAILEDFKSRLERIETAQNEMVLQVAQIAERLKRDG